MNAPTAAAPAEKVRYGKYWLLRRLAKGGMAEIFLAMPVQQGRENERLVIKRMLPQYSEEEEFLQMFLDEARLASQLNHPSIVRILDLGMEAEHLFIAMEYIDGRDLESVARARKKQMNPAMVARIALDTCAALAYAHAAKDMKGRPMRIVHRDVTPENIMLTRRGEIKLVDFGVAKAASKLSMTRPGVVKGKLNYMAPEHILGRDLDGRADLFSLGAALYEITTAIKPFERGGMQETVGAIVNEHPKPPDQVIKGYPAAFSAIVMKALEKDPNKRFANAEAMRQELERYLASTGVVIGAPEIAALLAEQPKPPAPPPMPPPLRTAQPAPMPSAQDVTNPAGVAPAAPQARPASRSSGSAAATGSPPRQVAPAAQGSPPRQVASPAQPGSGPRKLSTQGIPAAATPPGSGARRLSSQSVPSAPASNRTSQPMPAAKPPGGSPPKQIPRPLETPAQAAARRAAFEEDSDEPATQVNRNLAAILAGVEEEPAARPAPRPPPPPPLSGENEVPADTSPPPLISANEMPVEAAPPPVALELNESDMVMATPPASPASVAVTAPEIVAPKAAPAKPALARLPPKPAPVSPDDFAPTLGMDGERTATVSRVTTQIDDGGGGGSVKGLILKGGGVFLAVVAAGYLGHLITARSMEDRLEKAKVMEERLKKLEERMAQPAPPVAAAPPDASAAPPDASAAPAPIPTEAPDATPAPPPAGPDASILVPAEAKPAPAPAAPEEAKGAPAIISVTGQGPATIDGKPCNVPCAVQLEPGEHLVQRPAPNKFELKVTLKAGQTERVRLP